MPDRERRPFSIICLSGQEWEADLPTNRQQIMLRAARRGHSVLFVETGGFVGTYLWEVVRRRGGARLRRLVSGEDVAPAVHVWKAPNLLPWGRKFRLANRLNCALSARAIRRVARALPEPRVLWIYDPLAAAMAGACGERMAAYDCVDDYAEQAGGSPRRRKLVAEGDALAARRAAVVFATTTPLYERHHAGNASTHLVRNVGDFGHFSSPCGRPPADLAELSGPVLGFAGNFLSTKVDLPLLEALARRRPDWTILLVGPARADTRETIELLAEHANVRWLGPKRYAELPAYVAAFDVGLIPYLTNAYTRSCFPLKLFEYMAAGKPVVASGLPELAGMGSDVRLVDGVDEFERAVEACLGARTEADRARRVALAAQNTWESRAERLLELVDGQLGR